MNLKKLSIRSRLIFGFAVAPAIMVLLIVIGIAQVNKVNQGLTIINDVNGLKQRYAINFRGSVHDRAIALRDIVLVDSDQEAKEVLEEVKKLESFYKEAEDNLNKTLVNFPPSEVEKKLINDINDIQTKTMPLIKRVFVLKDNLNLDDAKTILMNELKPSFIEWLASINRYIDHLENLNAQEAKSARGIASSFQSVMIILLIVGVVAAFISAIILIKSILVPLTSVAEEIDSSSKEITDVSTTISTLGSSLEKGSIGQSSSIESISSAVEELNAVVKKNVELSNNASSYAVESKDTALVGSKVVKDLLKAIDEINSSNEDIMTQINESNRQMGEIVKVISEIGTKTNVINDIVFQTKLLSFNASVEAARAGEHGKGFAVVAEEVGKLAQLSGNSAHEISEMLQESSQKVEVIVNETQSKVSNLVNIGKAKVETGVKVAKDCENVLNEIVSKVSEVTGMANEISLSSKEQSIGFDQITKNIFEMDSVIKQNTMLAKETAKTLGTLDTQSLEMRKAYQSLSELLKGNG